MIVIIMLMGVGFFYGSYSTMGTFINGAGANVTKCERYVSEDYVNCVGSCDNGTLYLQKVCATTVPYNPVFSSALSKQVTMYTLKESILTMVIGSFIALVACSLCFVFLICFARLIYIYIAVTFVLLLGFGFYLLKSIKSSLSSLNEQSIFYT